MKQKLSVEERIIVKEFSLLFRKYKHIGPLKLAELLSIAFHKEFGY
jgi:hypothetical protein